MGDIIPKCESDVSSLFSFFQIAIGKLTLAIFFLSPLTGPPQFFPRATTLHIRHDHQAGQADTWILPSPSGSCRLLSLGLKPTAKLKLRIFWLFLVVFFFFSACHAIKLHPTVLLKHRSNSRVAVVVGC